MQACGFEKISTTLVRWWICWFKRFNRFVEVIFLEFSYVTVLKDSEFSRSLAIQRRAFGKRCSYT